jgi:hypothetical protein
MSPVRIDELKSYQQRGTVDQDQACVGCGYNLKGLSKKGVCPECGRAVAGTVSTRARGDIADAPLGYLWNLRTGAGLMLLGAIGIPLTLLSPLFAASFKVLGAVAVALSAAWALGVWLVTVPRPSMPRSTLRPTVEWRTVRWGARVTQAMWPLAAAAYFAAVTVQISAPWLARLAPLLFLPLPIGLVGLALVAHYAARLADWAGDDALEQRLRTAVWFSCGATVLLLVVAIVQLTGVMLGAVPGMVWFVLAMGFASLYYAVPALWGFFGMARWALVSGAIRESQIDELRRTAAAAREQAKAERRARGEDPG